VALQASVARAAEDCGDRPSPDYAGGGFSARGAESPEAAARRMIDALAAGDVRAAIELTPVDESAALHVWGPTLAAVEPARLGQGGTIRLDQLQLSVQDGEHGAKVVTPTGFRWSYSDGTESNVVTLRDGCATGTQTGPNVEGGTHTERFCGGAEDPLSAGVFSLYSVFGWGGPPTLAVVERDGAWFVSPGRSIAASVFGAIDGLDRDEALRVMRSYFGDRWAVVPQEMWDTCGIARPAADAPRRVGEAAFERCESRLPDDYSGRYSPDGYWFMFGPSSGPDLVLGRADSASSSGAVSTTVVGPVPTSTSIPASSQPPG
jgi:hypothetical protein